MIEQLFGSKTRVKLLNLFFGNPNRAFYVREITRRIDEQINSVRRELSNLLSIGLIKSENSNNKVFYEVNQKYMYYQPLRQIFGSGNVSPVKKSKDALSEDVLTESGPLELKSIGHVDLAVLTGQFTRDNSVGVDFFVIGNVNMNSLNKFVSELEKSENKEVRYAVMNLADFNYRRQINDRFILSVLGAKKQILIDSLNLLDENMEENL